jgi:hypothetical protein
LEAPQCGAFAKAHTRALRRVKKVSVVDEDVGNTVRVRRWWHHCIRCESKGDNKTYGRIVARHEKEAAKGMWQEQPR